MPSHTDTSPEESSVVEMTKQADTHHSDRSLFPCPEDGCVKSYMTHGRLQQHLMYGKHEFLRAESLSLLDRAKISYAEPLEAGGRHSQWGYRRGLSSESLLLYLTETWNHHIDQGKVIGAIFIDFRKAFDSVCPAILSHKLQACGISGNLFQWLNSYLSDRHQFVELNGVKSPALEVKYGVPQGSLLGPRLFSIYVNDFPDCITQGELHLYADDTTAFVVGDNPDDVTIKLNCLFKEICTFCTLNKLTLHSGKSEVMIIQRDQFVGPLLPVTHGGTQIDYTTKTKLVGVVIDNKLTWKDQLEKTQLREDL